MIGGFLCGQGGEENDDENEEKDDDQDQDEEIPVKHQGSFLAQHGGEFEGEHANLDARSKLQVTSFNDVFAHV